MRNFIITVCTVPLYNNVFDIVVVIIAHGIWNIVRILDYDNLFKKNDFQVHGR